jgi:UDP-galactopyranose mutase
MTSIDAVVAGAGLWGCTVARRLAESGRNVLVLEKRPVVGGNVRCETDPATGIEIHTYGSHIFHTHLDDVWDFVNRFITFNGYQHKVLARYKGKTYFLPLGLTLVNQFYGINLTPSELPAFIANEASRDVPQGVTPSNFEEQAISFVGRPLYEAFIRDYTRKQWGRDPRELDASIIRRLPVRTSYDVNYFSDYRQGIPLTGYNSLFDRLLNHPNITVQCDTDWLTWKEGEGKALSHLPVFYSGPIDALFGYKFGALEWRSLNFEVERVNCADYQGTSVVNYTLADVPWTRIHEYKHYHPEQKDVMAHPETIICKEFPKKWELGDEPYYSVNNRETDELLAKYKQEAAKMSNITIGGRLGEYKYYDMDQSIARALAVDLT